MLLGRVALYNEQVMVAAWYNTRLTSGVSTIAGLGTSWPPVEYICALYVNNYYKHV